MLQVRDREPDGEDFSEWALRPEQEPTSKKYTREVNGKMQGRGSMCKGPVDREESPVRLEQGELRGQAAEGSCLRNGQDSAYHLRDAECNGKHLTLNLGDMIHFASSRITPAVGTLERVGVNVGRRARKPLQQVIQVRDDGHVDQGGDGDERRNGFGRESREGMIVDGIWRGREKEVSGVILV